MTRARPILAAAALAVVALGAVAVARQVDPAQVDAGSPGRGSVGLGSPAAPRDLASSLPIGAQAPQVRAEQWINSTPLRTGDLAGKVVLYDFWTFGCSNCRNTLPYVKAWYARYAGDGLIVVGIHTPEFDYERDPANVQQYVTENAITYPVALDPESVVWRDFDNHYWPQFYLHDRQGHRRLMRIGEGSYDTTEDAIRALLGVAAESPRAVVT